MAYNKIMYFNSSDDGWWGYRSAHDNEIKTAPQYLKVAVDEEKSAAGNRYYFKILEGPIAVKAIHYKQYFAAAQERLVGGVSKQSRGRDVLVESSPHQPAAKLFVHYEGHQIINYNNRGLATPVVYGSLNYAGVRKKIVMTGDMITPNQFHPVSIPDEAHTDPNGPYEKTRIYSMWFRIDAKTAGQNLTDHGRPGDRYFHLGRGSAGCFTNIYDGGDDRAWNTIANHLSKARVDSNQLYVGHISFQINPTLYAGIKKDLINFAKQKRLSKYVWENTAHCVPR